MRWFLIVLFVVAGTRVTVAQTLPMSPPINSDLGFAYASTATPTIDMTRVVLSEYGKPVKDTAEQALDDPKCSKCADVTWGHLIERALLTPIANETPEPTASQKAARWFLAERIKDSPRATLTEPEISLINRLVAKQFGPIIIGQLYPILYPNAALPSVQ